MSAAKSNALSFSPIWVTVLILVVIVFGISKCYFDINSKSSLIETKLDQVVLPDSALISSRVCSRYIINYYGTSKSWNEIRNFYMEIAPKNGWIFKRELEDEKLEYNSLEFIFGGRERHGEYILDIEFTKSTCVLMISIHSSGER